jgi:ABC-type sugar transport system ATPase subunit
VADLSIQDLAKTFKGDVRALRGISIDVRDREAVFLLGPSGAGKTTTLRLVAGLEDPTAGRIFIAGRDVSRFTPRDRNLAMVYDRHSLFPHLTVFENLAYPLRVRRCSEQEIRNRVEDVARTLQIEGLLDRRPGQLSGGQMQRVAIGRALVRDADVFLLDEPISHLDAQLRTRMRVEFKRLQRDFRATMLYVSHDQLEAMTMADRIVLINQGSVEQVAAPQDLFDRPKTLFAATFIGEPPMNILDATLAETAGRAILSIGDVTITMGEGWFANGEPLSATRSYKVGLRPQHLSLCAPDDRSPGRMAGSLFALETLGSRVVFDIETAGGLARVMTSVDVARAFPSAIGSPIALRVDADFVYLFDAETTRTVRQAHLRRRNTTEVGSDEQLEAKSISWN